MDKSKKDNLFFLLNSLWKEIKIKRRIRIIFLIFIIIFSSLSEIISLSSIIPFLGLLTKPENLLDYKVMKYIPFDFMELNTFKALIIFTLILIFFAFLSSFLKIYTQWEIRNLSADLGSDFSDIVYKCFIYKPYESIIMIDSSNIISTVTADVNELINAIITPLFTLTASLFISSSIIFTLFYIDGFISLIIFILLLTIYLISQKLTGKTLQKLGFRRVSLRTALVKNIQDSLGSIRDITLDNNQIFYRNVHNELDRPLRKVGARMLILSLLPKSIIDPSGISIIALSGLFFASNGNINIALPYLGALALGAQKIIPQVQMIYQSWASLKGSKTVLIKIVDLLDVKIPISNVIKVKKPFVFKNNIKFKNVSFKYKSNLKETISNLNLEIIKGERLGIVGKTGSGKSTLIDLLMGLLLPSSGSLYIDDIEIKNKYFSSLLTSWRLSIAHVPQNIFLLNATIAENIAIGVPINKIDFNRLKNSAEQACISKFIESTKEGYYSMTGERGVMLSGGQLQRIALARAFYKKANVLIFDEATSALDINTEKKIINSIKEISKDITMIFVAHRHSTLKYCDRIIEIENGNIKKEGSFENILKDNF